MTASTIFRKLLKFIVIFAVWIGAWQLLAMAVGTELLVPSPLSVLKALITELGTERFRISVLYSLVRVLAGFFGAITVGFALGLLTARFSLLKTLFSPILHIMRAIPVASFIILALVWIKTDLLPAFIAFFMGLPIIWESVCDSAFRGDPELDEAAAVFKLSGFGHFRLVTLPAVKEAMVSASVTCLGFCWKSAVAAEVICLPKYAIGKGLYTAKQHLEAENVFAYTAVTVLLSLAVELLLRYIIKKRSVGKRGVTNADNS